MPSCSKSPAATLLFCCRGAVYSLVFLLPTLVPGALVAQTAGADTPAPPAHRARTRSSLDERVRQFGKNLDLNEAQQAAVKKILEQRQQEALQIRDDPTATGSMRTERLRALQVSVVERIRAVLSEEQRQKYNPLAPRDIPQAPEQRSVEDWLKLTTPR